MDGSKNCLSIPLTYNEFISFQLGMCQVIFNVIGILAFYAIPKFRLPILFCKKLEQTVQKYRWFSFVYVFTVSFIIPGTFICLSLLDKSGIASHLFLGIFSMILILILLLNFLQRHNKFNYLLPNILQDWTFLPKMFRSLKPYDR